MESKGEFCRFVLGEMNGCVLRGMIQERKKLIILEKIVTQCVMSLKKLEETGCGAHVYRCGPFTWWQKPGKFSCSSCVIMWMVQTGSLFFFSI